MFNDTVYDCALFEITGADPTCIVGLHVYNAMI